MRFFSKSYETTIGAESDPKKLKWIVDYLNIEILKKCICGSCPCMLRELNDLRKVVAPCHTHGKPCQTRIGKATNLMLIVGFSCKDLCPLKHTPDMPGGKAQHQILRKGIGSSGATFKATIEILALGETPVYIGENNEEIAVLSGDDNAFIHESLNEIGFVALIKFLDAPKGGSRANRKRAWIIALNPGLLGMTVMEARDALTLMAQFLDKICCLKKPMQKTTDYLLKNDHAWIKRRLKSREDHKGAAAKSSKSSDGNWAEYTGEALEAENIQWSTLELPAGQEGPWFDALPDRLKVSLKYNFFTHPDGTSFDLYQKIQRVFVGKNEILTAIVAGSEIWLPRVARLLTGWELLRYQGCPAEVLDMKMLDSCGITDAVMKDLAGNMFNMYSFLPVLLAVLTCLPPAATAHFYGKHETQPVNVDRLSELLNLS